MKLLKRADGRISKLKVLAATLLVMVGGYFVYKYSYIYLERRKYSQAEVAIKKVAADLEAQGIRTEFSKGCQESETVFQHGPTTCSIVLTNVANLNIDLNISTAKEFINGLNSADFTSANIDVNHLVTNEEYVKLTSLGNSLPCSVFFSSMDSSGVQLGKIELSCGKPEKFALF